MKVKALRLGYVGNIRRYEGDVFEVPEKLFSKKWMEKFDPEAKAPEPRHSGKTSNKDKDVI